MKTGRNDPCHCGSGNKYKKCCMPKDLAAKANEAAASAAAAGAAGAVAAQPGGARSVRRQEAQLRPKSAPTPPATMRRKAI